MRLSKNLGGAALVVAPLFLAACGLDQVEVPVDAEVTIPGQPFGSSAPLTSLGPLGPLGSIDFGASDAFEAGGYSADDIESVKLVGLSLRVEQPAPPDGKLDFLDSITFRANDDVVVATLDPVPDGQVAADLTVTEEELVELVKGGKLSLSTTATGLPPRYETRLKVKALFRLDVAVF